MSESTKSKPWGIAVVAIAALTACLVWWLRSGRETLPTLTDEEAKQLVQLATVGIGHLENEKYSESTPIFQQLITKLPNEPIAARNLLIGYVLQADATGAVDEAALAEAGESLRAVEPESGVTDWLMGRAMLKIASQQADLQRKDAQTTDAIALLSQAVEVAPDTAPFCFDLFEAVRYSDEPEHKQLALSAIRKAHEAAPRNLFLLDALIQEQAAAEDDDIANSLKKLRELVQPLVPGIQRRQRGVDVIQLIDEAIAATEAGDWSQIRSRARAPGNFVRPEEIVRSDMRRVNEVSPLEFVVDRFSDEFLRRYAGDPPLPKSIEIAFDRLDVSGSLGDVSEAKSLAFADFDLDGMIDLIVLRDHVVEVFRHADGGSWEAFARTDVDGSFDGLLLADLDRDEQKSTQAGDRTPCYVADPDVVLFGGSGITVLQNGTADDGSRTLEIIDQLPELKAVENVRDAIQADFDHDGDLDLVVASDEGLSLWSNIENLTFEPLSRYSQLPPAGTLADTLFAVDWDRDVDIDILVGGASMPASGYLENLRHGELRWHPFDESFGPVGSSQALVAIESDGNVSWDLLSVADSGASVVQTRTVLATSSVKASASGPITEDAGEGVLSADYDNDGNQDAIVWGASSIRFLRGSGDGTFTDHLTLDQAMGAISTMAMEDFDADGDLDLAVVAGGEVHLFRNNGGEKNQSLRIRLHGITDSKIGNVNHMGIGSLIEIKGDRYQAQVVANQVTHFGVGSSSRVAVARALFTNGIPQAVIEPQPNQSICEEMKPKSSCPYVYTWTGDNFEFFTDLLWAAPIGLQFADGVLAKDRPWEYLLVPGESLEQKDSKYVLQITEELWEAAYFDEVELIAVDHPSDVEVYSNEKVGPEQIAEFKVHTVRNRLAPVAARNKRGHDVLPTVATRDGDYLRGWDTNLRQGVVDEHYLELDLGELADPAHITLFLTGWIQPTDTSLNVAMSHNPLVDNPRPPYVLVPDTDGEWREVIPFMGFPGGKTKTIAIDLSNAFLTDDYRLRIATSHEIYWDEVFFAADEEPAEMRLTNLKPIEAHLHYRGFSREFRRDRKSPHIRDYSDLTTTPNWPPMQGRFTRYGDVRELLHETDDFMVVMGAGDEMTVTFDVPDVQLPDGWKRDFVLHNVGWDKDADLNTVYGQSVEPLPFVDMKSYPHPPGGAYPDTPRHREYLNRYQTRTQNPARFWKLIQNYDAD